MTTFTLNSKTYQTDQDTLAVLHSIMPSAKATGDSSAVIAVVELGLATGRIVEQTPPTVTNDEMTVPCPLGCGHRVAAEGDEIHFCATRVRTEGRRKVIKETEYVGTWDGAAMFYGQNHHDIETQIQAYREELIASGLTTPTSLLDGGDPEHVDLIEPDARHEQTAADMGGGWASPTIAATPLYRDGDEAYIASGGYVYGYFSPCRPLNFIFGLDCVIVQSSETYHDFIFTKKPLGDRVEAWELLPYTAPTEPPPNNEEGFCPSCGAIVGQPGLCADCRQVAPPIPFCGKCNILGSCSDCAEAALDAIAAGLSTTEDVVKFAIACSHIPLPRIAGHMTCECAQCCRVQRCFHSGETWICVDREACETHTAEPQAPADTCRSCGGPHPTYHCPEIGAAMLQPFCDGQAGPCGKFGRNSILAYMGSSGGRPLWETLHFCDAHLAQWEANATRCPSCGEGRAPAPAWSF